MKTSATAASLSFRVLSILAVLLSAMCGIALAQSSSKQSTDPERVYWINGRFSRKLCYGQDQNYRWNVRRRATGPRIHRVTWMQQRLHQPHARDGDGNAGHHAWARKYEPLSQEGFVN